MKEVVKIVNSKQKSLHIFFSQFFNIEFYENSSCSSGVISSVETER
jgi:hypothetical protein